MELCKFKNVFGQVGNGLHSYRCFDIAIFDLIFTNSWTTDERTKTDGEQYITRIMQHAAHAAAVSKLLVEASCSDELLLPAWHHIWFVSKVIGDFSNVRTQYHLIASHGLPTWWKHYWVIEWWLPLNYRRRWTISSKTNRRRVGVDASHLNTWLFMIPILKQRKTEDIVDYKKSWVYKLTGYTDTG